MQKSTGSKTRRSKFALIGLVGLIAIFVVVVLLRSSSDDDAPEVVTKKQKPKAEFSLLIQDTVLEGTLAGSVRRGLEQAFAQIAQAEGGFADYENSIREHRIGTDISAEEIKTIFDGSVAIFAVLDEQASYLVAQVAALSPVPLLFLNDGPLRTCNPHDLESVLPTAWQIGMTDAQTVEPFLISLAAALKGAEESFRFSFFSTDLLWQRQTTRYVKSNVDALGFRVVHDEYLDPRITDFYGPLRQVLRHRANVLYIGVAPGMANRLFEQTSKMLIYRDYALATLFLLPEERLASVGEGANRVWTISRYKPSFDGARALGSEAEAAVEADSVEVEPDSELQTDDEAADNTSIWSYEGVASLNTAHATGGYIAAQLLQKAAIKARSIDPVGLNAGLLLANLKTPNSNLWFNRSSHVLTQPFFRVRIQDGEYREEKFLGDIEHPGLNRCAYAVFRELEEEEAKPYQSIYE